MRRIKKDLGNHHKTQPIKDPKELKRVIDYLIWECDHAKTKVKKYQADRNYILILIGFNTGFRAEDLLQLKVKDVEKGYWYIKENKTGKRQMFKMNNMLYNEIKAYLERYNLKSNDYLFMGQKKFDTYNKITRTVIYPITKQNCTLILNKIKKACGIKYTFGLHSLRKTYGYQNYANGMDLITVQRMYSHSTPINTLMYIMWDDKDIAGAKESVFMGKKD